MTTYLLDANVFIEGSKRYYGFDFCPAFWDWLMLRITPARYSASRRSATSWSAAAMTSRRGLSSVARCS